jgi:prephenate dehydrogenase
MGGSLALALRGHCRSLAAVEVDERTRQQAMELGIVDQVYPFPPPRRLSANLIILATPILTNIHILGKLEQYCSGSAVVIDLGSTKSSTIQQMSLLNEDFVPVGGHPMCGKESGSLDYAEAGLFNGAAFALVPLDRTSTQARQVAHELVVAIGALPFWIDADTHDQWVAYTSHLPYLLANTLAYTAPPPVKPLVGPGFRSTTRLSGSNIPMMMDILKSNRTNILSALSTYTGFLQEVIELLRQEEWLELRERLMSGSQKREYFNTE